MGGQPDAGEFGVSGTQLTIDATGLNSPPLITAIGDQLNDIGDQVTLALFATDADGDPFTFSATNLPPGLNLSGNEITGTITTAGIFNVAVTVSDDQGGISNTSFNWIVDGGTPVDTITVALGDLKLGIAAHDERAGSGYIMYSEESVHTRFAAEPPSAWASDHLIAVVFENGAWHIDRNKSVLVPFTPRSSDRLLVEVDFGANTATHLIGVNTTFEGIRAGYVSGDLVVTPEMWAGSSDAGEFGVAGTEVTVDAEGLNSSPVITTIENQSNEVDESVSLILYATDNDGDAVTLTVTGLPGGLSFADSTITGTLAEAGIFNVDVTASDNNGGVANTSFTWTVDGGAPSTTIHIPLGDLKNGIAAHDQRTGTGYIMYSEESVHTRFADNPPSPWQADNLISVVFHDGQWKIDRNQYTLVPFTPLSSDHIVASVDFGLNTVTHLVGVNIVVEGINAGYVSGDLVITPEMWGDTPNEGEFGVQGTTIEIPGELQQSIAREDDLQILADSEQELPEVYGLNAIFPNPFNTATTIEYQLPEESAVRVEIFNITGQRVKVVIDNSSMPAGNWNSIWGRYR